MPDTPKLDKPLEPFDELATPALLPCLSLQVEVGPPTEIGPSASPLGYGHRRVIPITGGRVRCERRGGSWEGRVLAGGADFQLIVGGSAALLEARYVIETQAGDRIYVENRALRSGPPDLIARLARGEPVDPALIYFRCVPRFETAAPALAWMMERLFLGSGARYPDRVALRMFEVA